MERKQFPLRPNWEERCMEVGFDFHNIPSLDGTPYWVEGVGYRLTSEEVDALDDATNELAQMAQEIVRDIVTSGTYPLGYGLSDTAKTLIEHSWKAKEVELYGRFDLVLHNGAIKMLEYNADTPTALLEASVVQWNWLEDHKLPDQFNSIHEKLISRWKVIGGNIAVMHPRLFFTAMQDAGREDWGTVEYLMDTATQAGIEVSSIVLEAIGYDQGAQYFVDTNGASINTCFKLYPWEWMVTDEFAKHIVTGNTRFIEPAWKMLLSNKALLPVLWEKFPNHPLLLPSYFEEAGTPPRQGQWARKPILSREGANVSKLENGNAVEVVGSSFNASYDKAGYIVQEWAQIPAFDGFHPVIGAWVIGGESAGIGIREDRGVITGNDSHFVPHYFD